MTQEQINSRRQFNDELVAEACGNLMNSNAVQRVGDALTLLAFIEFARYCMEREGPPEVVAPLDLAEEKTDPHPFGTPEGSDVYPKDGCLCFWCEAKRER